MAKKQFKAESKRLLDLMINSIYTHKEIFLREIISNASDAMDKLSYMALTDDSIGLNRSDFKITISADKENRTLTVADNGIGMDKEDLENNLGVIASSGSYRFRKEMDETSDVDIIGQFGVGFYSAFMVADSITVNTKKQGSDTAWRWQSSGADGYTVTECEKDSVGTEIVMHIKADTEDDSFSEYLDARKLYALIKKYSDYIRYPIRMEMPQMRKKDGCPEDKPEWEEYFEEETVNSMVPLWQRKKSEVSQEEYNDFYKGRFGDYMDPQSVISVSAEGTVTYKALLFIPAKAPMDYYTTEFKAGLQLYSSGVMIMDRCEDLLPPYFNFVRGVVDSPDLSLNISRELLQHDRQLKVIANNLEKKIKNELERMLRDDREGYEKFYGSFSRVLKLGIVENFGAKKDFLQDLLLFYSSTEKKLVSLREYADRCSESQKFIYVASGESTAAIDKLPQTEILKDKGIEILYLTDKVDEFLLEALQNYADKPFRSALDDDLGLEEEKKEEVEEMAEAVKPALDFLKEALGDAVTSVVASKKLKSHPVCLSSGEGLTFEMEKYFAVAQPELQLKANRILEINTNHPIFAALEKAMKEDEEKARKMATVLFTQAQLIAGFTPDDPSGYTDLLCSLMI